MRLQTGSWKRAIPLLGVLAAAAGSRADSFTGPAEWRLVNTNAVQAWQAAQAGADTVKAWPGVVADVKAREVRLLAEAVGHREGVTAEFLLVGPQSDRAYEAVAVTVANPGDIARAVEGVGLARGGGVGSIPFRFWPYGERVSASVRRVGQPDSRPLQALVRDAEPSAPLFGDGGLVFTGGRWAGPSGCLTDTNLPCSVISLFNEPGTLFDVPFQTGQSDVYGRLALAEALPYGQLLEIVLRPLLPADGQARVMPLAVKARMEGQEVALTVSASDGTVVQAAKLADSLSWMRAKAAEGRELYVTLGMDESMPLTRAVDVARVFGMLDGKGLKLDGRPANGVFPRAFLPQEKWRERKDRSPQPFEVHLAVGAAGKLAKRLVFIEEDWKVEGLDPKLTPRETAFEAWEELPALVRKVGGADNKVPLLFVFAPADVPLSAFMPGVRAVSERLPLVYVFAD